MHLVFYLHSVSTFNITMVAFIEINIGHPAQPVAPESFWENLGCQWMESHDSCYSFAYLCQRVNNKNMNL